MIGYITIGSNDLRASAQFFDALFDILGGTRAYSLEHMVAWGFGPDQPMIISTKPENGEKASIGNGVMIALKADSREQIHAVHKLAMELGGTDEGSPGPRGARFYGAYFRDLDGNKFNVFLNS